MLDIPKVVYKDHKILTGFRPGVSPRFYFFLVHKNGARVSKHCIWAKKDSKLAKAGSTRKELQEKFWKLGIGRVFEKIDNNELSSTLLVLDKDEQYEVNLDELSEKLVFDIN